MKIHLELECQVHEDPQISGFVSYCPALKIYSQGSNIEEAVAAMKSAVTLTLGHAFDRNKLDQLLHDALRKRGEHISVSVDDSEDRRRRSAVPIFVPLRLQDFFSDATYSARPV